jgi:hypothetical protein
MKTLWIMTYTYIIAYDISNVGLKEWTIIINIWLLETEKRKVIGYLQV